MPDSSSGSAPAADLVTDLVARYGRQAVQLFAALAGATGLFYTIGFIIVNVSLLRLGVYETALISVGYVAPGVAFAIIFSLSAVATIGAFGAWRRVLGPGRVGKLLAAAAGVLTVVAGSYLLGWAMWFFQNVANGLVVWAVLTNLGVAIMAYAEEIPVLNRMMTSGLDDEGQPLSRVQMRLKSPAYVLVASALAFVSVLVYGQFVYDQVPPVFGGGLPIVVRFFGDEVSRLEHLGIGLEPGGSDLTERVQLVAQTEDRYIVRATDRAISFDKNFVQGIRYEPPEFFLNPAFRLARRTRLAEQLFEDGRYNEARSEFDLVLREDPSYVAALRGRAGVFAAQQEFDGAIQDYRALTAVEPVNGRNFYNLASAYVQRDAAAGAPVAVDDVVSALTSATAISPTLGEEARADAVFDPLRPTEAFDVVVYGSGADGARWFRERARKFAETGSGDDAIPAYRRAIQYAETYAAESDALTPGEILNLHVELSQLYLQRDVLSAEAVAELQQAIAVPGLSATEVADTNVALSEVYLRRDPLSDGAVAALQAAVAATGEKDPKYLNRLADLYRARNETDRALETYGIALRLGTTDDPNRRDTLIGQGRVALEAGQYLLASAAFSQALTLAPGDASTLYDYSRALAALKDPDTQSVLRSAIDRDSSLAERARQVDWQLYFSNAGAAVTKLIDAAVLVRQARASRDQGKLDEAIAAYRDATALDPDVAVYWREYGDVLAQKALYPDAIVAYQNVLQRGEEPDAAVLTSLGLAQIGSGDYTGAIESLTASINAGGEATPARVYASLASAYELTGQYDLAGATYQQAARRDPTRSDYLYRAGLGLLLAGQIDQGLGALQPIVDQGWLRVESTDVLGLRETASTTGVVLKTLAVGTLLRISGGPLVGEGQFWWPVVDQDGTTGWVRASGVAPSAAPVSPAPTSP